MPDLVEPRMILLGLIRRFGDADADAIVAKVTRKFPSYSDDQARKDFDRILSLSKSYGDNEDVLAAMSDSSKVAVPVQRKKTRFQKAAEVKEREKKEGEAKAERKKEMQEASNYVRRISYYQIVSAKTKAELTQKVNDEMKRGWYPYGGVSFAALGMSPVGGNQFIQAVVRFK